MNNPSCFIRPFRNLQPVKSAFYWCCDPSSTTKSSPGNSCIHSLSRGWHFPFLSLNVVVFFLTAVLSLGQFQNFWSPTAPCTSFNCNRVLTTKPKAHKKSLTHDSTDWRWEKKSVPLPYKHHILHLQSVVMKQLTLGKAASYHSMGTFICSTPYSLSLQGLYQTNRMNQFVYITPGQLEL